ncbi:thioredoxin [Luteimonas sp. R10]|uniref:thioredoxin n=1 Tax=Luteimonas sp. R10 TaxID=3108176 RepID=UPI00308CBB14|nr:thioredoxin [Luteimonas sp. R10]
MPAESTTPHVFDATAANFETDVLQKSLRTPVLIDFWAEWCGPCKTLGPILEKLAADYNGAFVLARVDVDREQQLAAAFQVRSIPTVFLLVNGQPVDAFPGALPEGELREFLKRHGIEPAAPALAGVDVDGTGEAPPPPDPHAEVLRLRQATAAEPDQAELKLDLALALLRTGAADEAERLLDALPANLATDDRCVQARARLGFAAMLEGAPPAEALEAAIAADPDDLRARHLLGVRHIVGGDAEAGLEQFIEMLRRDRDFDDGLPRRALIDAFRVVDDAALVGRYRRRMASLLF